MTRRNDFAVGLTVLLAAIVVVVAAIWLGGRGTRGSRELTVARFRTLGGVGVGDPVVLRGVPVGRVESIRLVTDGWVEAELRVAATAPLPADPVAVASSASLFGEWQIAVLSRQQVGDDPEVVRLLDEAAAVGGDAWPGATLPDIGYLTQQASRIAGDVGIVTDRISGLVDSSTVGDLRASVQDFRRAADRLAEFTTSQSGVISRALANAETGSAGLVRSGTHLENTLSRFDSATGQGTLVGLMTDARGAAAELRAASADFRALSATVAGERERITAILTATDNLLTRLSTGQGTLGMLATDSTLYREATLTVVQLRTLLADVQANPRRYFRFSVF
jgi:phospholipid/cholesterol/gamma-HCH transport system substrate-binding protein